MNQSLLNNPRIVAAAAALFQHGRRSEHYIRTIRQLTPQDKALVKYINATDPAQVEQVRDALGVQPWETR